MRKLTDGFLLLLLILSVLLSVISCGSEPEKEEPVFDMNELKKLCQLSTLNCKIHTCAELTQQERTGFWIFSQDKEYTYVLQYDGIFNIGVEFENIEVNNLTNTVNVTISEPKLLDSGVDEDSLSKYPLIVYDEDMLEIDSKKLSVNDGMQFLADAQEDLTAKIESEKLNYSAAEENAKELIRNFIAEIGKQYGIDYSVTFSYS